MDEGLVMDDKHKSEWYDKNAVVIQAKYEQDFKEIVIQCRRRNIHYSYDHSQKILYGYYRVVIEETGPKTRKLCRWAIMKFNIEGRFKEENIWILSQDEKK